jgi:hypothetical protein
MSGSTKVMVKLEMCAAEDECGNHGWVQGDTNCNEGSCDRCEKDVSAIEDEYAMFCRPD